MSIAASFWELQLFQFHFWAVGRFFPNFDAYDDGIVIMICTVV
jgi:hypothetical protein